MPVRSAECGVRSVTMWIATRDLTQQLRIPHSALGILVLLAACTPVTTRPDFLPDPRAARLVLDAPPARVTPEIAALVTAESLQVERMNALAGYVETAWCDTRSRPSLRGTGAVPDLPPTVTVRSW